MVAIELFNNTLDVNGATQTGAWLCLVPAGIILALVLLGLVLSLPIRTNSHTQRHSFDDKPKRNTLFTCLVIAVFVIVTGATLGAKHWVESTPRGDNSIADFFGYVAYDVIEDDASALFHDAVNNNKDKLADYGLNEEACDAHTESVLCGGTQLAPVTSHGNILEPVIANETEPIKDIALKGDKQDGMTRVSASVRISDDSDN